VIHLSAATPGTLRERFVQDMTVRGFTDKTRHDYIRTVAGFAAFLERSPNSATAEDIRRFQIHQSERGMNAPAMNSTVAALRFFFNHTADRPDLARKLIRLRYPRKLPNVLSPDEAARLIAATTCLKHRAALCVAYGAGLRVAEVASLKVGDIDSERMLIRVERGKGGRCRHALLSPDLLALLPAWWQQGRRDGVMLPLAGCSPARTRPSPSHPPAQPRRRSRSRDGRSDQARQSAHATAQLCHSPARGWRGHSRHPGPARPCEIRQHRALHPRGHQDRAHRDQPARQDHRLNRLPDRRGSQPRRVTAVRPPQPFQ